MGVVADLQKQRISGPTSPKFSPLDWLKLGARPGVELEDLQVIAVGTLVHGALEGLRKRLSYVSDTSVPADSKRLAFVGLVNRECVVAECIALEKATSLATGDRAISMDQVALLRIDLPAGEFAPEEICETTVDGVGRLLRMCPEASDQLPVFEVPVLGNVIRDFNIANAYLTVEDLWLDVVWNGVRPVGGANGINFVPGDRSEEAARAVAQHRHVMTSGQSFNIRYARLRNEFAAGRIAVAEPRKQVNLRNEGGSLSVGLMDADEDFLAHIGAVYMTALPEYYGPVLTSPAPDGSTLTLKKALDAHLLMASMAQQLAEPMIEKIQRERQGEADVASDVTFFAPLLPIEEVRLALEVGLGVSPDEAAALVNFMTFGASKGAVSELWSSPFVRYGADQLVVCLHPLRNPNLRWLVDVWLKRMGFPLDFRGTHLEVFARTSLSEAAQKSLLASITQVFSESFFFTPPGGREEEIDLLVVVGRKVVIGEVKCFLEPVTPIDRRNHREKIVEASDQVARKAEAVRSAPEAFRDRARQYGVSIPTEFDILPVVVLNHAIGAGQVVNGIPIIDLRIFEMFFEGSMQWLATVSPDGNIESCNTERFYDSEKEGEQNLGGYLNDPPQVRHLKSATRVRLTRLLMPGVNDDTAIRAQLQIDSSLLPGLPAEPEGDAGASMSSGP